MYIHDLLSNCTCVRPKHALFLYLDGHEFLYNNICCRFHLLLTPRRITGIASAATPFPVAVLSLNFSDYVPPLIPYLVPNPTRKNDHPTESLLFIQWSCKNSRFLEKVGMAVEQTKPENPATTFDDPSTEQNKSFIKALQV